MDRLIGLVALHRRRLPARGRVAFRGSAGRPQNPTLRLKLAWAQVEVRRYADALQTVQQASGVTLWCATLASVGEYNPFNQAGFPTRVARSGARPEGQSCGAALTRGSRILPGLKLLAAGQRIPPCNTSI